MTNTHASVTQFVSADRMMKMRGRFDEKYAAALRHGNHLWIATVCYYIQPPLTDGTLLDVENMAMDPAIGCYICEEVFTDRIASRRCAGEPS